MGFKGSNLEEQGGGSTTLVDCGSLMKWTLGMFFHLSELRYAHL